MKGHPHWDWLLLPTIYSFSFDWGFLNFVIGTPIAILFVLTSLRRLNNISNKNDLTLIFTSVLLFFSHIILYVFFYCLSILILTTSATSFKQILKRLRPLLISLTAAAFWVFGISTGNSQVIKGIHWDLSLTRFNELLVLPYQESPTGINLIFSILFLFTPLLIGGRFKWKTSHFITTFGFIIGFMLLPSGAFGASLIFQRFGVFFIPLWLLLFETSKSDSGASIFFNKFTGKITLLTVIFISTSQGLTRVENYKAQSREQEDFKKIVAQMQANSKVLSMPFDQDAGAVSTPVYPHFPVWYQTIKGGQVDPSFATIYHMLAKYKIENIPPVRLGFEANPISFDWVNHRGDEYDYFIFRSHTKREVPEFSKSKCPIVMIDHIGNWWLYGPSKDGTDFKNCNGKRKSHHNFMFSKVYKSRDFETLPEDFAILQINPKSVNLTDVRAEWKSISTRNLLELDIDLTNGKTNTDFKTTYIFSEIDAGTENVTALFDLGSDDGLTVWHDGLEILSNSGALRAAKWGDEKLQVNLHSGINYFLFRVNNAQGGWRLLARISAMD